MATYKRYPTWSNVRGGNYLDLGISLGKTEYPTKITFVNMGAWNTSSDSRSGALALCDGNGGNAQTLVSYFLEDKSWPENRNSISFGSYSGNWTALAGASLKLYHDIYFAVWLNNPGSEITVETAYVSHKLTIGTATGGTATSNPASGSMVVRDNTVTLSATPATGYRFDGWTSNPTVTITNNRFTMPDSEITVTPVFTKINYAITKEVTPSGAGTITAAATGQYGDSISVSQTPATGYTFQGWRLSNGSSVTDGKFTMPAAAITLTAVYTRNSYTIHREVSPAGAGTITAPAAAGYDDLISISQTPATGYTFQYWTLSTGAPVMNNRFNMPNGEITITAVYSRNIYKITAQVMPTGAGAVEVAGAAGYSDEIEISQTANEGYFFDGWALSNGGSVTNGKFIMPDGDIIITANYLRRSVGTLNKTNLQGGTQATLTISSESAAYTHQYRLYFAEGMDTGWVDIAEGISSVTFTIPTEWANRIPDAATKSGGTITIRTYRGEDLIGTWETGTLVYQVPEDANPDCGEVTTSVLRTIDGIIYADIGEIYTQGHSGVKVKVGTCTGKYNATIVSIRIQIGGYSGGKYDKSYLASSAILESGILTASGETGITITVTDSRGLTVTASTKITVQQYNPPMITGFDCWRVDSAGDPDVRGENAQYVFDYRWTALGTNEVHTDLVSQGTTETDTAKSGWLLPESRKNYNVLQAHKIILIVRDLFETTQVIFTLGSGKFILHFSADGKSAAVGHAVEKVPGSGYTGTFEIDEDMEVWIGGQTLKDYILAVVAGDA